MSNEIKIVLVEKDVTNFIPGKRITLEREDGKRVSINIPNEEVWDNGTYGLNLVFGDGDHYE